MSLAKLKNEARKLELREEWEKAIELYLQALKSAEEESDQELPLFNRVGDLYIRLGKPEEAVRYYERAADRYADEGLFNNAIALCNKALRYAPRRTDLLRKLGQFSARQGFLTDARRWYLEYAETMFRQGALDPAFEALDDFAALSEDPSIRVLLARRLQTHGRTEQAIEELKRAYRMHRLSGDDAGAEAVRAEALEIDPDISDALEAAALAPEPEPVVEPEAEFVEEAGFEQPADVAEETEEEAADAGLLPGFEATRVDEVEETAVRADEELPGFEDLPEDDSPLPTLDDAQPAVAAPEPLPGFETTSLAEPGESGPERAFREARYAEAEGRPEAAALFREAHEGFAAEGRYKQAIDVLEDMIRSQPDEIEPYRLRIEYARMAGESHVQVRAHVELGRLLARSGDNEGAQAEYRAALDVDPANLEARYALEASGASMAPPSFEPLPEPTPEPPPEPAASSNEYVDLGEWLAPVQPAGETRYVVQEEEPSGDEDRDFAELLKKLRSKIDENIEVEDAKSHYDLGLAFKDMGLVDEAIRQFQVALRSGDERLKIYEELGQCFLDKAQPNIAVKVLSRALQLTTHEEMELIGVYYYLGAAYEALGRNAEARDAFERVIGLDVTFRDVSDRLARL